MLDICFSRKRDAVCSFHTEHTHFSLGCFAYSVSLIKSQREKIHRRERRTKLPTQVWKTLKTRSTLFFQCRTFCLCSIFFCFTFQMGARGDEKQKNQKRSKIFRSYICIKSKRRIRAIENGRLRNPAHYIQSPTQSVPSIKKKNTKKCFTRSFSLFVCFGDSE